MTVYWLLFLFPLLQAFGKDRGPQAGAPAGRVSVRWVIFWLFLVVVIGLRERVGGDWFNYLGHFEMAKTQTFSELATQTDPGYKILNWLSIQFDLGIYGVNTVAAMVFATGLVQFCRQLPRPWLAATVAVPYLVIVVAMGYSRQGISLGMILMGLVALKNRAPSRFGAWTFVAAAFHRSAIIMLPLAALTVTRRRIWTAFWIAILMIAGYLVFAEKDSQILYSNYVERGYQSQGALIRLGMNVVAAAILLFLRKRLRMPPQELALWRWMSLLAVALFAAYFVATSASTALDRIGLYLLPLQLVAFSNLPDAMGRGARARMTFLTCAYYAAVLFVWLNFAANAYAWLPYRTLLLAE